MKKFLKAAALAICLSFVLTMSAYATTTVQATWDANMESDLAGYNIYRTTTPGSGYQKLNGTLILTPTYNDEIPDGTEDTFYYVVTAVDESTNESGYSNEASISIDSSAPLPPTGLSVIVVEP